MPEQHARGCTALALNLLLTAALLHLLPAHAHAGGDAPGRSLQRDALPSVAARETRAGNGQAIRRARLEAHLGAVEAGTFIEGQGGVQAEALDGWRIVLDRWLAEGGHDLDAEVRIMLALAGLDELLLQSEGAPPRTHERRVVRGEERAQERRIARVPSDVVQERELRRVRAPQPERRTHRVSDPARRGAERWALPIENPRVTSSWGPRVHPITGERGRMHHGVDYGAPTGTPVLASASGRVLVAGWCGSGAGNCVVIEHAEGWRTQYFHLSRWRVRAGQQVAQGERIADVGATGSATGPHLHFEIRRGQESVDPERWIGRPIR